jgi:hypothetical protein
VVRNKANTAEEYLKALPEDRRDVVAAVRDVILANLPEGYEESVNWGMLSYEVPLSRYPDTYNDQPLQYAALASQKRYMSLYLNNVYGDPNTEAWFTEQYRATGKRLDMGKSCVRFRTLDDLPLELVGDVIARTPVDDFIARYEVSRRR